MTPRDASDDGNDKTGGRWSDLDRPPLNSASLRRALVREGGLWSSLDVVPVIGSTNTDLAGRADRLPEGGLGRVRRGFSSGPIGGFILQRPEHRAVGSGPRPRSGPTSGFPPAGWPG